MPLHFTRTVSEANVKITATIEAENSAKADLLIPDPPVASGLEILSHATITATTGNNSEGNRQDRS